MTIVLSLVTLYRNCLGSDSDGDAHNGGDDGGGGGGGGGADDGIDNDNSPPPDDDDDDDDSTPIPVLHTPFNCTHCSIQIQVLIYPPDQLQPKVKALADAGMEREGIAGAIRRKPAVLALDLETQIMPTLEYLQVRLCCSLLLG